MSQKVKGQIKKSVKQINLDIMWERKKINKWVKEPSYS